MSCCCTEIYGLVGCCNIPDSAVTAQPRVPELLRQRPSAPPPSASEVVDLGAVRVIGPVNSAQDPEVAVLVQD